MSKVFQWVINLTVGVVSFVFFLVWLFPIDQVVRHYISQIEESSKGAYRVTLGDIEAGILFKSRLTDFALYHKKPGGGEELWVKLPEVRVGLSYLPLLAGRLQASFDAQGAKGSMDGRVIASSTQFAIKATLSEMSFADLPLMTSTLGVDLKGQMTGTIDLDFPLDRLERGAGEINLDLKNWVMPPKKWVLIPGMDLDLPETKLSGTSAGKLKFKMGEGKVDLASFSLTGEDLVLALKGKIQLNKKIDLSRVSLDGSFSFSEKMEKSIDWLVSFVAVQRKEDGSFPLALSGRMSKPRVQIGTYEMYDGNNFKMPSATP